MSVFMSPLPNMDVSSSLAVKYSSRCLNVFRQISSSPSRMIVSLFKIEMLVLQTFKYARQIIDFTHYLSEEKENKLIFFGSKHNSK